MQSKQVVIITGASSGIGKETAKKLANIGFKVYGVSRNIEKMKELTPCGVEIIPFDITDEKSVENCVNTIYEKEKRIDIIINNAGYGSFGPIETVTIEEAHRQFEVNLFGLGRLIQKTLPIMRAQKKGRIINVSSMAAYFSEPNGGWYHATKAALERYSDSLRMEVKQFGIDVVLIQPGMINTEWQNIAIDSLLKTSQGTAYELYAKKQAAGMLKMYKFASQPTIIADAIVNASTKKRPRLRYRKGRFSNILVFLSIFIPNRLFDWLMIRSMNN